MLRSKVLIYGLCSYMEGARVRVLGVDPGATSVERAGSTPRRGVGERPVEESLALALQVDRLPYIGR